MSGRVGSVFPVEPFDAGLHSALRLFHRCPAMPGVEEGAACCLVDHRMDVGCIACDWLGREIRARKAILVEGHITLCPVGQLLNRL